MDWCEDFEDVEDDESFDNAMRDRELQAMERVHKNVNAMTNHTTDGSNQAMLTCWLCVSLARRAFARAGKQCKTNRIQRGFRQDGIKAHHSALDSGGLWGCSG